MRSPYLEVTFRQGRALAAYLYLPREAEQTSHRTETVAPGLLVDFDRDGRAIGIEITSPSLLSLADLNRALERLGLAPMTAADLAPLQAA